MDGGSGLTGVEQWTVTLTAAAIGFHFFDSVALGVTATATFAVVLGAAVFWIKNRGRFL